MSQGNEIVSRLGNVTVKATGNAVARAITVVEIIKKRNRGLHQLNNISSINVSDKYEPTEEGLEMVETHRMLTVLEVTLSKEQLDKSHPG